jgi:hypothetical protein
MYSPIFLSFSKLRSVKSLRSTAYLTKYATLAYEFQPQPIVDVPTRLPSRRS